MSERIIGPALRLPDGSVPHLPAPARHNDLISRHGWDGDQGFWTSAERYVSRQTAWHIAEDAGQITRGDLARRPGELFTECMW